MVRAYLKARSQWSDPADSTDLVSWEEGGPALVTRLLADRVRQYGPRRKAIAASTYTFPAVDRIDVLLPPRGRWTRPGSWPHSWKCPEAPRTPPFGAPTTCGSTRARTAVGAPPGG